ncbi:hypothetical protein L5515_019436 [Caenorhabditis briggsae]|uniref:Uncharacterized protein n=1 Tax=Caenorhabditis briggsae TaxID=6238 RepID=A0AAE9JT64_CAEBR|nr:hypothetical protein L5515_019436 [Caenorhabditis briggsae]
MQDHGMPKRLLSESSEGEDPEPYVKSYRIEIRGESVGEIARKERDLLHFLQSQEYEASHVTEGRILHNVLDHSSAMVRLEPGDDGFDRASHPMVNARQPKSTPVQVKTNPKENTLRKRSSLKECGKLSGPGPAAPSKMPARKQEATPISSDEEEDESVSMADEEGPKKRTVSQFEFTCLVCEEILKTNANLGKRVLINHALARHISTDFYKCCGESFHTVSEVKRHFKVQHIGQKFEGFGPKEMWQMPEFVEAVKTCFGDTEYESTIGSKRKRRAEEAEEQRRWFKAPRTNKLEILSSFNFHQHFWQNFPINFLESSIFQSQTKFSMAAISQASFVFQTLLRFVQLFDFSPFTTLHFYFFIYLFSYFSENLTVKVYLPRSRVPKDTLAEVVHRKRIQLQQLRMWSMLQSMLHPTALRSSHDRCLCRLSGGWLQSSSENGAPETKQVMRRVARKAIQQKEPVEEGTEEYQALLQEARDHHSECPVFKDPELGQLTVLNLYNPNKRSKAIPQEVGSETKMAKHLFQNYL